MLFREVDKDGNKSISLDEFLSLLDVLLLDLELEVESEKEPKCQRCQASCSRIGQSHVPFLKKIVNHRAFEYVILAIILLNLLQVCCLTNRQDARSALAEGVVGHGLCMRMLRANIRTCNDETEGRRRNKTRHEERKKRGD